MDLFCKDGGYSRTKQALFAGLLIIILIPVFVVAMYNRPVADDYNYSIYVYQEIQENGVSLWGVVSAAIEADIAFYNEWQGLYTSAFILALQPGVFGEQYYAITTFLMVAMIFGTFYLSTKWLLKEFVTSARYNVPLIALFITFVIVQDLPGPTEGLYWYNGAMNYIPFCLLTLLNILLVCKIHLEQTPRHENILLGVSVVLSFLISGGNHVTGFLNLLAMLGLGVLSCVVKKYKVCASAVAAMAGFVVMMCAPGTAIRAEQLEGVSEDVGMLQAVVAAMVQSVGASLQWANFGYFCFLILLTPLFWRIVTDNRFGVSFRWPLLPIAVSFCVMGAMWCVPYYAGASFGMPRLQNVIWITYLVLSALCYTYLLGWVRVHFAPVLKIPQKACTQQMASACLALGCVGFILLSGNGYPAIETYDMMPAASVVACLDLATGRAQGFGQQTDERIALYHDADVDEVLVEPLAYYPSLLFFIDLGETPDVWPSIAISEYYGKPISLLPDETLVDVEQ